MAKRPGARATEAGDQTGSGGVALKRSPRAGVVLAVAAAAVAVLVLALSRPGGSPSATGDAAMSGGGSASATAPGEPAGGPESLPEGLPPDHPPLNGPTPGSAASGSAGDTPQAPVSGAMKPAEVPAGHPAVTQAGSEAEQVSIQWLGHSCFYIFHDGTAVVTDPFDSQSTGFPRPDTGAHMVTVSSPDPEHGFVEPIRAFEGETREVLRGTAGSHGRIKVRPVVTSGPDGSANTAYIFEAGPLRIAHLGNLGAALTPAQVKELGPVDVVMVPAANGALTPKLAVEASRQLGARIVLPMAYSTPGDEGRPASLPALSRFVEASPFAVTTINDNIIMVGKNNLPASTEIYRLQLRR